MTNKLKLLFSHLFRIYVVLPKHLRKYVILLFILMVLLGFVELASIISLTAFFSIINRPEIILNSQYFSKVSQYLPNMASKINDPRKIIMWVSIMPILLIGTKNLFAALVIWKSSMLGERVAAYIGNTIMQRYLYMPYSWHLSSQSSQALTYMQWRFSLGQMLIHILTAYSNIITVFLLFLGLTLYEPAVTLSCVIVMTFVSLLTYSLIKKKIDKASLQAADEQQKKNASTVTAIGGIRELIIYQQQHTFLDAIRIHVSNGMRPRTVLNICPTVPTWTLESAGFLLIWLSVFFLINIRDATLEIITSTVAMLALTAWRVLPSLNRVVGATVCIRGLQGSAVPCLNYFEELQKAEANQDILPDPLFTIKSSIIFEHVSYRYPGANVNALNDINCSLIIGNTIGLIGRSGAGKSTFINLLCGLLEPTSGRILVDGHPMSPEQLVAFRQKIGYVPQSPYLLSGTVAQNVAFCDWGKKINEYRVQAACQAAAVDFLGDNAMDINKPINANGSGLSGGQMQRISIARALYNEPTLLVFDEATSALDQASESIIQETVVNNKHRCTSVIAAHRLSTLNICDQIICFESGTIFKIGAQCEVIEIYKKMLSGK